MSTALDSKPLNGNGHADVNVDVDAAGEMTEVKPTSSVNSCSGISSSSSSSSSSTVVSKRARRRHQSKQNKLAIKQAEAEQKLKFQNRPYQTATGKEKEKEKENDDGDEREEKKTNGDIDEEMEEKTSIVKSEIASPSTSTTEIEFIPDTIDESSLTPAMAEMASVLERFQKRGEDSWKVGGDETNDESATGDGAKSKEERIDEEIRAQSNETNSNEAGTLSRRKQKERDRLAIADLKQLVAKPDVVELHDVASADPKLLVYLKSFRNTVPVPQHWSQKRKYLQNKRGYEKAPFKLPECIENTGISKMRGAQQEKEAKQTNKQQQRAKMQPKMGKIDIDYQILHDAFFRYQTKPPMTQHGELYYEGREHELKMTEKKPGHYSNALREALGMKDETSPPPWLLRMQTVGPPPAYPYLAIPGVSAPIPTGARYGFGEGEWGKPPVDIHGRPLYGDVFGVERRSQAEIEKIDTTLWGGLEPESEGEEEEEEEAEGDTGMEDHPMDEVAHIDGTSSTLTSMSGLSTPEVLNLRKADGTGTETPDTITQRSKSLYTVLEEKKVGVGGGIFGTQHTYVLPDGSEVNSLTQFGPELSDQAKRIAVQQAKNRGQVDVALNPDELEGLDAAALKRKYDAKLLEASELSKKRMSAVEDEDEEENRKKKRKKGGSDKDKAYKDFKF